MCTDPYIKAALLTGLKQPQLSECADYLVGLDMERHETKGKWMTQDHLTQEAVKWARR